VWCVTRICKWEAGWSEEEVDGDDVHDDRREHSQRERHEAEPSGEDLTELLLERFHQKVDVTNLLVQNLTPNGRGTGSA
jgi:hypothetical protein